jgi:hypothetical protein
MTTEELKGVIAEAIQGDVVDDAETLRTASRDTSLFVRVPELVVYPKDAEDVSTLVREVARGSPLCVGESFLRADWGGSPHAPRVPICRGVH